MLAGAIVAQLGGTWAGAVVVATVAMLIDLVGRWLARRRVPTFYLNVVAGLIVALGALGVDLPDRVATFTRAQVLLVCGGFATLQSLAFLVVDNGVADLGIGFYLMLLGSVAVLVGAIMISRDEPAA